MKIHAQRRAHDCGVAALASYLGIYYEDAYVAAAAVSPGFAKRQGLSITEMMKMSKAFGRPLVKLHWRKVDIDEHVGILGVNWHRSAWKRHGCTGHWVLLRAGTIIDPSGPSFDDATDYLVTNKGRAGTLLMEAP
jgi:ABC-type bacteriocin/lantibiotic exporter with double-glycine peptidase domain